MNKQELMKRLEAAVDLAIRGRMYGKIEVSFQDGVATLMQKTEQEKLSQGTRHRDQNYDNR